MHYDVCVLGGGPAGYAAAFRALDLGRTVALVERDHLGGAGVYKGALSSKTLWELAKDYNKTREGTRGYHVKEVVVDFREVFDVQMEAVQQRWDQLDGQVRTYEETLGPERFRCFRGQGKLLDSHTIEVQPPQAEAITLTADYVVLAMGSRPRKLPNIPIDEQTILTSDGLGNLDKFPESLVILGAGVIGCEYATIFSLFGQTDVRIIDKANRILPFEDEDVAEVAAKNLEAKGVTIHKNATLDSMTIEDGRVKYVLWYEDGRHETHYAEKALVSVGRVPNTEGAGLENAGVELTDRGHCIVDDDGQTNLPHICAVGDLTPDICLVNVGETEGRHVMERWFGGKTTGMSYENVSTIMFLNPEVAGVGMNEKQARRAGIPYQVARYGYEYTIRAIAMRATEGFFKLLVTDDDEMRILGMRAIGPQASSAIQGVALLIGQHKTAHDLAESVYPHPSVTEGIQECARMLLGTSILKPSVFHQNLRCWRYSEDGEAVMLC